MKLSHLNINNWLKLMKVHVEFTELTTFFILQHPQPVQSSLPAMVVLLLKNGANPNLVDYNCETPLHHCAYVHSTNIPTQLLDYGANINVRSKVRVIQPEFINI